MTNGGLQLNEDSPNVENDGRGWSIAAASAVGTSHVKDGKGCDDSYCFANDGPTLVAAVGDGAGSRSGTSALGSHVACKAAVEAALRDPRLSQLESLDEVAVADTILAVYTAALQAVESTAASASLPIGDLATTLTIAVMYGDVGVFAQLGDGIVVVRDAQGVRSLIAEEKSEYANETTFLTSSAALERNLRVARCFSANAFALSTDGLRYKALELPGGTPYVPLFEGLWAHLEKQPITEHELAGSLAAIEDDQTGDDKTLVIAMYRSSTSQEAHATLPTSARLDPLAVREASWLDMLAPAVANGPIKS